MSYVEFNPDDNLGYKEFYVSIKVKTVGAYIGDGTTQQLKDNYEQLLSSGELSVLIEEYLQSKIIGEHLLDSDDCYDLGLIDKLIIEVKE